MKQSLKSLTIPKLGLTITKQKDVFLQGTVFRGNYNNLPDKKLGQ